MPVLVPSVEVSTLPQWLLRETCWTVSLTWDPQHPSSHRCLDQGQAPESKRALHWLAGDLRNSFLGEHIVGMMFLPQTQTGHHEVIPVFISWCVILHHFQTFYFNWCPYCYSKHLPRIKTPHILHDLHKIDSKLLHKKIGSFIWFMTSHVSFLRFTLFYTLTH